MCLVRCLYQTRRVVKWEERCGLLERTDLLPDPLTKPEDRNRVSSPGMRHFSFSVPYASKPSEGWAADRRGVGFGSGFTVPFPTEEHGRNSTQDDLPPQRSKGSPFRLHGKGVLNRASPTPWNGRIGVGLSLVLGVTGSSGSSFR